MALLANLKILVGADTVNFSAGMRQVEQQAASAGVAVAGVGAKMHNEVTNKSMVAGLALGSLAGKFRTSAEAIAADAGAVGKGVAGATGSLLSFGEQALLSAGALGKLSNQALNWSKIGPDMALAMGSLAVATGAGAYALTRFVMEVSGADKALRSAAKPAADIAAVLAEDQTRFDQAAASLSRLIAQMKLSGPEWEFANVRTKENALRIGELTEKVLKLSDTHVAGHKSMQGWIAAMDAADGVHKRNIDTLNGLKTSFYAGYGAMTKKDISDAMAKLAKDVRTLADDGMEWSEIVKLTSPRLDELSKAAGRFKDKGVLQGVEDLRDAIKNEWLQGVDAVIEKVMGLPTALSIAAVKSKEVLAALSSEMEGQISGGLGRGIEKGKNAGQQALEQWRQEVAGQEWKISVKFDPVALEKQLRDLGVQFKSGTPNTAGATD